MKEFEEYVVLYSNRDGSQAKYLSDMDGTSREKVEEAIRLNRKFVELELVDARLNGTLYSFPTHYKVVGTIVNGNLK